MSDNTLILPSGHADPNRKIWYKPDHNMIRTTRRKLRALIENASLTSEEERDVESLLDREIDRIHLKQKSTLKERLDYWSRRKMSARTRAFKADLEAGRRQMFSEQIEPMLRGKIAEIPEKQRTKAVISDIYERVSNKFISGNGDPISCGRYVNELMDQKFIPELLAKEQIRVQNEYAINLAQEKSLQVTRQQLRDQREV